VAGWLDCGLEPRRRITGAEIVAAPWMGAGLLGARPELKSKPQASQNCPDRSVPQFGHGSAPGGAGGGADPGGVAPSGGAAGPGGRAAATNPVIRIPHVSQ
jgi:hypothetical protein